MSRRKVFIITVLAVLLPLLVYLWTGNPISTPRPVDIFYSRKHDNTIRFKSNADASFQHRFIASSERAVNAFQPETLRNESTSLARSDYIITHPKYVGVGFHNHSLAPFMEQKFFEGEEKLATLLQGSHRSIQNESKPDLGGYKGKERCNQSYKRSHFLRLEFQPGRSGNTLLQVNCLLARSIDLCLTPTIDANDRFYRRSFDPVFDLRNVVVENITHLETFHKLPNDLSDKSMKKHNNWTLITRCWNYEDYLDHKEYILSSVRIKKTYNQVAKSYLKSNFVNKSTVAIHVRRTDQINRFKKDKYADLEWYTYFINRAMDYLKRKQSNVSFIFLSDDMKWCEEHFQGNGDVHFSPFESAGYDLGLIVNCDHVVLTIGTFGWTGAWLGTHKSVVYSKKFMPSYYSNNKTAGRQLYMPSWIGID